MERRHFMSLLAAGAISLTSACSEPANRKGIRTVFTEPPQPVQPPQPLLLSPPPSDGRVPLPAGTLTSLPGDGNNLALTVDDGADADVIGAYIEFARDTGARFTFFVTACYDGWTEHSAALRPLVESGQIQLGNHAWDHPDLTSLSSSEVASQLARTKTFLRNMFGVDGTPYYRPPYGYHNETVDRIAADNGYTTPTFWYGSLSDSGLVTEQYLLECASKYFTAQSIVIGHANHPPVTHVYSQLVAIVRQRQLAMVTFNDVLFHSATR